MREKAVGVREGEGEEEGCELGEAKEREAEEEE